MMDYTTKDEHISGTNTQICNMQEGSVEFRLSPSGCLEDWRNRELNL